MKTRKTIEVNGQEIPVTEFSPEDGEIYIEMDGECEKELQRFKLVDCRHILDGSQISNVLARLRRHCGKGE